MRGCPVAVKYKCVWVSLGGREALTARRLKQRGRECNRFRRNYRLFQTGRVPGALPREKQRGVYFYDDDGEVRGEPLMLMTTL